MRPKRPELQNEAANGGEISIKTAGHGHKNLRKYFHNEAEFFLLQQRLSPGSRGEAAFLPVLASRQNQIKAFY